MFAHSGTTELCRDIQSCEVELLEVSLKSTCLNTPEGYQFLNLHFTKTQDMLDRGSVLKRKQNLIFWIG